jgi:hypothetical protein
MTDLMLSALNARNSDRHDAPVELTGAEVDRIAGGLNPQPLPPGMRVESVWLSDHWYR